MGNCLGRNNQNFEYGIIVQPQIEGQTSVLRRTSTALKLEEYPDENVKTLKEIYIKTVQLNGNKPCFFSRDPKNDNKYTSKTYNEVFKLTEALGSGIINLQLMNDVCEYNNIHIQVIGIYSKTREEWMLVDLASTLFGFTIVPIYETLGLTTIPFVFEQSNINTLFCTSNEVKSIVQIEDQKNVKNLVFFDEITAEQKQQLSLKYNVYTLQEVIQNGQKSPQDHVNFAPKTNDPFTFSYTSGTVGNPKGALISHRNMCSFIAALTKIEIFEYLKKWDLVHLSYLPLPHVLERVVTWALIYVGGQIYYFGGDVTKIVNDFQEVKPTFLVSVPRFFNKIYDSMQTKIRALKGPTAYLAQKAIATKLYNLKNYGQLTHPVYDRIIFKKMKDVFGGRIKFLITGSAPIDLQVKQFLSIVTNAPFFEAYGQTECTGVCSITLEADANANHVGGPYPNCQLKLVDIPEMNYLATNKDSEGKPLPSGEICIQGPNVFLGYYKDEEKTKEAIDNEGWLHTGDVGQFNLNGSLKIIDRKKNIFKLSQGEYIAAEKIENIFLKATGITEVFIYGDSLQSYLVGIAVPDKAFVEKLAASQEISGTFEQLCKNEEIIKYFMIEMNKIGKQDKLFGFELIQQLYLDPVSFIVNQLTTATFKLKRFEAKKHYLDVIKELYKKPIKQN